MLETPVCSISGVGVEVSCSVRALETRVPAQLARGRCGIALGGWPGMGSVGVAWCHLFVIIYSRVATHMGI